MSIARTMPSITPYERHRARLVDVSESELAAQRKSPPRRLSSTRGADHGVSTAVLVRRATLARAATEHCVRFSDDAGGQPTIELAPSAAGFSGAGEVLLSEGGVAAFFLDVFFANV